MSGTAGKLLALDQSNASLEGEADGWGAQLQEWLRGEIYRHYAHVRLIEELHRREPFNTLLDVGCGSGMLASYFVEKGIECVGIDNSRQIIEHHARKRKVPVVSGSVGALPFAAHSFEMVTCLGLIEHLADPVEALRQLHRITAPQGRAIVTVPRLLSPFPVLVPLWFFSSGRFRFGWKNMVGRMYTRGVLRSQLESAGWMVEEIRAFKGSSLLEWARLPFRKTLADCAEHPLCSGFVGIMLMASCRKISREP